MNLHVNIFSSFLSKHLFLSSYHKLTFISILKRTSDTDDNDNEDSHTLLGFGTFLGSPEKMNSSDDTVICNQDRDQQQTTTNSRQHD